ncbi:MAG: type III pantothenate kinase [Saccharofermentans sp.]|nr:type III pantothenate kinase [Saccharofermentans sp.]
MILAVDIGNTHVVFGGFVDDELVFTARIATDTTGTEDEYASKIINIMAVHNIQRDLIEGAVISSVVPPLTSIMKKAINFIYDVNVIVVGPGIKTGINLHCDVPSTVGADIICCCVAAHNIYGSPSLVVDMGTATKLILVGDKGTFEGVSIIPGVMIGLNALSDGTAQLPQVSLENPGRVIAKNTVDCMKSGVIYGNASMIDGMIDRSFEEYGSAIPVYATGGLASTIVKYCRSEIILDEQLVLKGLNIIYKKNA